MPDVVRFALATERELYVPGLGRFDQGIMDIPAGNADLLTKARYLLTPYRAVELGTVDETTPYPDLPAVGPGEELADPYPQYLTGADAGPRVAKGTIAMIGSSITAQNSVVTPEGDTSVYGTSTRAVWGPRGYWHWANVLLGQRLTPIAQKGVGGNTTTQMAARFDADILELSPLPGWVIIEASPNDAVTGITSATTITNLTAMVTQALNAGLRVILTTVPPSSYIVANTTWRAARAAVNAWVKRTAPGLFPGLVVVDMAVPLIDPASSTGAPLATYFVAEGDGGLVHPNAIGAARMGAALARALSPVVPAVDTLASDPGDGNPLSNPFGSGGSGSALPTGWSATATDGSALTGTVATVASTDGIPAQWGQVAVTSKDAHIVLSTTLANAGWAVGDRVYAECEFQTDAAPWANIKALTLRVGFVGATGEAYTLSVSPSSQGPFDYRMDSGVFRTPTFAIPSGATQVQWVVQLLGTAGFGAAGTAQGTFRIRRPALRKAVA